MYGSGFTSATLSPRVSRIAPSDAAAIPLPSEETTPPVTQINLVIGATAAGFERRDDSLIETSLECLPPVDIRTERLGLGQHRAVPPAQLPRVLALARGKFRAAGEIADVNQRLARVEERHLVAQPGQHAALLQPLAQRPAVHAADRPKALAAAARPQLERSR